MKIVIVKVKGPDKDVLSPQNRLLHNIRTTLKDEQPAVHDQSGYQVKKVFLFYHLFI